MSTAIRRFFFWLSGAGTESLEDCPKWEQRKYVAFGATVLVPTTFAFIACFYAMSTLTDDWRIIVPVALVWAFIIMTIDRALLATYRPYLSFFRKLGQFMLRFVIAFLMGLTISHPLTLLLFRDTIQTVIERERQQEIEAVQATAKEQEGPEREKIAATETEIAALQKKLGETFTGNVPENWELSTKEPEPTSGEDAAQAALNGEIARARTPFVEKIAKIEEELKPLQEEFATLQQDLDGWQKQYELEINGQRSGYFGVGPRARSIEADQLVWRRAEAARLSGLIQTLTAEKNRLRQQIAAIESGMLKDFEQRKTEDDERQREERGRIAVLKKQIQEKQAGQLVSQLERTRDTISRQIDTKMGAVTNLHAEIAQIGRHSEERIEQIRNAPRRDVLTQTLALHKLFKEGEGAGQFALYAYAVLTLLFMLVDTIPLLVKFFTKAGPYDTLLDCDEVRFQKDHEAFVQSYVRYVDELNQGRALCLTQNKPLERALIEGVERSRVAKEFLESLVALEKAFDGRMRAEQEAMKAGGAEISATKKQILEHMAQTFYADLRERMEQFFEEGKTSRAAL